MEQPSADRSTALRRALLFLLACSPIWLLPHRLAVFHPIAMLGILVGATLLFLWWDKRPASVLGLDLSWRRPVELLGGLVGGVALIAVVAVLLHAILPFEWTYNPAFNRALAAVSLLYLLIANGVEELLFRGYAFERLIVAIGHWPAQLLVALLFAVYHLLNGWTWQVAFTSTVIGSVLFGLVFVRTRSVPAATGFHAAANWTRDLVLLDPPTMKSWFGPIAGRNWTPIERQTTMLVFNGVALLACALLWWSIRRRDRADGTAATRAERRGERVLAK